MNKNFTFFKFNFLFSSLVVFIFFLLIEGIFYNYYQIIRDHLDFLPYKNIAGYNPLIWFENGVVEILQAIILLISLIYIIKFIYNYNKILRPELKILSFLYLAGLAYYFFEEISWGQHLFGWTSPEFFSKINSQNETNLHNTSNLLNELPRGFLLVWCSFSFLIVKLINLNSKQLKIFILPSSNLKFISFLILLFFLPDFTADLLNINPISPPYQNSQDLYFNLFLEVATFNFVRLSELQELLFNCYIVSHSYYLIKFKED